MTKSSTYYAKMDREYAQWSKLVRGDYLSSFQEPTHESIRHAHFVDGLTFNTIANRHRRSKTEHYLSPEAVANICRR